MKNLKFDSENFTKTITEAIKPELEAVEAIIEKKKAIADKQIEFEQKLKNLDEEKLKNSQWDDLLEMSYEKHIKRREKLADLDKERNALISFSGSLTAGEAKCDSKFTPARERLVKVFQEAVHSYIITARLPIVEAIESILNEDNVCRETIFTLYNQVCRDTGIKQYQLGFGFDSLTSNLYPLPSQRLAMKTMIEAARKAIG